MHKTMGKLFVVCEWVMRLAYVNLLWFLFSIAGLLIFGIMPATVSLFTIVRKWQMKDSEIPIWKTFFTTYKKEFRKSNVLGFILGLSGIFIALDYLILRNTHGSLQMAFLAPLLIITVIYVITLLYIFPVYAHYDLKIIEYLKNACLLGIMHFHMTLLTLGASVSLIFLFLYQPAAAPFFSTVSIAWVLMFGGFYSFRKVETRQKKLRQQLTD